MYADPSVDPKKRLFGLITETPRRIFLGVIWFDDSIRNATPRRMLVECYGRDYSNRMSVLAEDLSRKFGTSVSCRLVSEDAQEELFISDNEP